MHSILVAALSVAVLIPAAQAAQPKFFDNLSGSWSGSGQAYVKKYGDISANCKVAIKGADSSIDMDGSCGMLVFRQALGLSLKNVGGNKYAGTYTGSATGTAKLEGTLTGDRTAQMVLQRTGPDSFDQIVNDTVEGKERSTSNFEFKRL